MGLDGKLAVITGGSQGLGFALACALVEHDASVALLATNAERLREAQIALGEDRCSMFVCDVRDPKSIATSVQAVMQWRPRVDILINNAGVWTDAEIETRHPERRKLALEINTFGTIEMTEAWLPHFRSQGFGHILNVISVAGDPLSTANDTTGYPAYGATKWAVTGYTKSLRQALAGSGIKVTSFFPGGMDTHLFETAGMEGSVHGEPWMMDPAEVAQAALFALTAPEGVLVENLTVTTP